MKEEVLESLQGRVGYRFDDLRRLEQALTHSSWAHEHDKVQDLERLEFLGDSVFNAAVTILLWRQAPQAREGDLSRARNQLVNTERLAAVGRALDLGSAILLGKGERRSGGADKDRILEDAVEALAGAIFLDGGFDAVCAAAERWVGDSVQEVVGQLVDEGVEAVANPRNTLQEITQERWSCLPEYEVLAVDGPAHAPEFHVSVSLQGKVLGRGTGSNKRQAHRAAAVAALRELEQDLP